MKTSIKTLKEYLPYIKNTLNNTYHNDYVEGNNNFIKVLKRIAPKGLKKFFLKIGVRKLTVMAFCTIIYSIA